MRRRLEHYILEDHPARWKNDFRCMLVAFAWAAFQLLTSATTETGAIKQGLVVLTIGMTMTTLWHGLDARYFGVPGRVGLSRRLLIGYARDLAFVAGALMLSALPLPAVIVTRRFRRIANAEITSGSLGEIASTAKIARDERITIHRELAATAALRIMKAGFESPNPQQGIVLSALTEVTNYISFLNGSETKIPPKLPGAQATRQIEVPLDHLLHETGKVETGRLGIIASGELVKDEDAGIIEKIGAGHEAEKGYGPSTYVVTTENGYFLLDGLYLRNIIFRDVPIVFRGGPIVLKNVRFIDCTFLVSLNETGQEFLRALAAEVAVNFSVLG